MVVKTIGRPQMQHQPQDHRNAAQEQAQRRAGSGQRFDLRRQSDLKQICGQGGQGQRSDDQLQGDVDVEQADDQRLRPQQIEDGQINVDADARTTTSE